MLTKFYNRIPIAIARFALTLTLALFTLFSLFPQRAIALNASCDTLPSHGELKAALESVVEAGGNGGLSNQMWVASLNRDGVVCAIAFSGEDRGAQWPGSRVIAAQKANTANAFSLSNLALSSANLFSPVQPGQSLFGLQASNPVNPAVAYRGNANRYGQSNDPMVGGKIGGVNVFGGGLALYDSNGEIVGGLGVSGDTSCTDHNIAWKVRDAVGFDYVPAGVSPTGDDNIIYDISIDRATGQNVSASGFGHPSCDSEATKVATDLPETHPIGQ